METVIAGNGRLALPGLVNAHNHIGMTILRSYSDDLPLWQWLREKMWPVEDRLTEEDVYIASLVAIAEMLRGGTTTFADMYFHMQGVAKAVEESGIRGVKPGPAGFIGNGDGRAAGGRGPGHGVWWSRQNHRNAGTPFTGDMSAGVSPGSGQVK